MTTFKNIVALQFSYFDNRYEENFKKLSSYVKKAPKNSIVVAPELSLSNFSFNDLKKASDFSKEIEDELLLLSRDKILCLSVVEEEDDLFYNRAKLYHNEKLIYQRDKYELFKLGDEHKYFQRGKEEDIKIVEIEGIRYGVLICFEIRFISLWEKLKGVDILLVPALWGKPRKKQLNIIANALSVINQCFVVVANSANDDMAKNSLISSPFGEIYKDDRKSYLEMMIDLREIKKMRKYLNVGIEC